MINFQRTITILLSAILVTLSVCHAPRASAEDAVALPQATAEKLPQWRGFNLPYRYNANSRPGTHNRPWTEESMQIISELGFNFVRLPLDYRYWIVDGDWHRIDKDAPVLGEIDQVVAWGAKYGIHVCLNFHKAPGYCINGLPGVPSLWEDADAQDACIEHWAYFARRYRGIPNERVSFNLWNEPARTDSATHYRIAERVVDAIRAEDPKRLIICDGFSFKPAPELNKLGVAQAARGYNPSRITHYKASWSQGSDTWPVPLWPRPLANGWMHGPSSQKNAGKSLVVEGPVPSGPMRIRIGDVFNKATLALEADGKEIWRKEFIAGPQGGGDWKKSTYHEQWKSFQCTYDREYEAVLPEGVGTLRFFVPKGNWIGVTGLTVTDAEGREHTISLDASWGTEASRLVYAPKSTDNAWVAPVMQDRAWLQEENVQPWIDLANQGVGVMVGEFGVYNKTPHDVTLAFLEDYLQLYQEAGFGWALWNLDGAFGILDSERADVEYEDWNGHKLDRKMLELLQKY